MAAEPLKDLSERDSAAQGRIATVEARLEAESTQAGPALLASVVLANGGAEPVELINPFDLLQWQLLDERGPVTLPARRPNLLAHTPASAPWKLDPALPLVEVRAGGELLAATALDRPELELQADAELSVTFAFGRAPDGGRTVELVSGDYQLVCMTTLIDARDPESSRIVRSSPLQVRFERVD